MSRLSRLKPAVRRGSAQVLAGLVWVGVGLLLGGRGVAWASGLTLGSGLGLVALGVALAVAFWYGMFGRVVGKNLGRLAGMPERMCVFALQSWKGWVLVGVMIPLGIALRHAPLSRAWLVAPYVAMGGVLLWGGVQILMAPPPASP
ncbi:MAG: hypothetical protein ABIO70_24320 [Pseudomonadota bacterium]